MPFSRPPAICLVGVGPRGTSIVERLGANAAALADGADWVLHLVDDSELGAGRVWRTDQTVDLCMNTLAGAVTLFTDPYVTMAGPVREGPNLYEWCLLAANELRGTGAEKVADIPLPHRVVFDSGTLPRVLRDRPELVDEMVVIRPESHPSRALYGAYSTWVLAYALGALPEGATVQYHHARATRIRLVDGAPQVDLDTGETIEADDVILSPGWLPRRDTEADAALSQATRNDDRFVWVRPGSPVDQDLSDVTAGAHAIVRGMGMGFFDTMTLLTIGRGGRFLPDGDELRYEPSGREPILHVTSRRGVPFRSKSLYGGLPPRASLARLDAFQARFDAARPVDFETQLWPLIVLDGYEAWYRTLHKIRPEAFTTSLDTAIAALDEDGGDLPGLDARMARFVPAESDRFDLSAAMHPANRIFESPQAFDRWVAEYIQRDLHESALGRDSPLKAALWAFSSARKPVSKLLSFDGTTAESFASRAHREFMSFGGMVGSGPPAFRSAQLLALAKAGLVHFVGPAATLSFDATVGALSARSPNVVGSDVRSRILIDAWMHMHDVSLTADPIIEGLRGEGILRPHHRASRAGVAAAGSGADIERFTSRLIDTGGAAIRCLHLVGVPVSDNRGDTIISPMPKADATFLRETDGVARAALETLFPPNTEAVPFVAETTESSYA